MGWNLGFFRRKSEENTGISAVERVESGVSLSFSKLKSDMEKVGLWIKYFAEEAIRNRQEHSLVNSEISSHDREISELKKNQELMIYAMEKNSKIISELNYRIEDMKKEVSEKAKEPETELGTCPGTSAGQIRDKSIEPKKISRREPKPEKTAELSDDELIESKGAPFDRGKFLQSELEVIKALYYSERPMGYDEIAKLLGKSEKSIRNIICDARRKGIEIMDKPIGIREKGFYLSGKAKVLVSGR
jgi:hypothetical protein